MSKAARRCIAVVTAVAVASCVSFTKYGYQYRVRQDFIGGEEPETPSPEARELLATATTVAFYPPDVCLNTDTQTQDKRVQQLRASCGVLLSTLERAAERAGYEVYSWQNLRGGRPIDFAKQANVDVLFEINEFDLGTLDDSATQGTMAFFESTDRGNVPLAVTDALAQKCRGYAQQSMPPGANALTGTVDIKTVSVKDGRSRWRYRKTLSQSLGRSYPEVTFSRVTKGDKPGVVALVGAGAGFAIAGIVFAAVGSGSGGSDAVDLGPIGTDMIIGGVIAMAAGALLQVVLPNNNKPSPDEVLCNGSDAVAPVVVPGAPPPPGGVSVEHTFNETTQTDPLAKQKEQIRDTMIGQFIGVLKDARSSRPQGPTPKLAPAPAPPQP